VVEGVQMINTDCVKVGNPVGNQLGLKVNFQARWQVMSHVEYVVRHDVRDQLECKVWYMWWKVCK
jgi:hypothetical protein